MNHTPGPWMFTSNIREGGIARIMPAYRQRYCIATIPTGNDKDAKEADARLIAAAPELLEALQEMVDGDAEAIDEAKALGVPFPEEMLKAYRKAIAAIAKATGGQP